MFISSHEPIFIRNYYSCTNAVSSMLVRKLNLNTSKRASHISFNGRMNVNKSKQVFVLFTIVKFKGEVIIDVVLIHANSLIRRLIMLGSKIYILWIKIK